MRTLFFVFVLLFGTVLYSQEFQPELPNDSIEQFSYEPLRIKPLRVGLRIGIPHLITANVEYVTPLLDNRVAITLDYLGLSKNFTDGIFRFDNFEAGTNIYFKNTGKGLYGSLTYFSFRSGVGFVDYEFYDGFRADGRADFDFNSFNVKLGAKLGKTVYFRVELGYGFGKVPDYVQVISTTHNLSAREDIPNVPGISSSGIVVFNLGFGVGFL